MKRKYRERERRDEGEERTMSGSFIWPIHTRLPKAKTERNESGSQHSQAHQSAVKGFSLLSGLGRNQTLTLGVYFVPKVTQEKSKNGWANSPEYTNPEAKMFPSHTTQLSQLQ